jgi:hypothetical protein
MSEQMSDLAALLQQNPAHPPEWWNRGVRNVMGGIGGAIANAVQFPSQYARGETGYTPGQMASEQPQATNWGAEMAMGMVGAPGGRGGLGSGARLPAEKPGVGLHAEAPGSWILRNKETGQVMMETSDPTKVAALNTAKYEAVPIADYLAEIGRSARSANPLATGPIRTK